MVRLLLFVLLLNILAVLPVMCASVERSVKTADEFLEACKEVGAEGGTIRLSPGAYEIAETVRFSKVSHVNIVGSGWNTVLRKATGGDLFQFNDTGFCTVRDVLLQGNPKADSGSGIVFTGSVGSCTIDFVRFIEFPVSGVRFEGERTRPMSSNTVSRCHFIGNGGDQLYSFENNDFYILQNQFGTHSIRPKTGCRLERSSAGSYSLNYHWGNVNAFVITGGSHYNRIENNRFEESRQTAVIVGEENAKEPCVWNTFTGNTVHTNSQQESGRWPAIELRQAYHSIISNNIILSWNPDTQKHKHSLLIHDGCDFLTITGNILRHNADSALKGGEGKNNIIKDNQM